MGHLRAGGYSVADVLPGRQLHPDRRHLGRAGDASDGLGAGAGIGLQSSSNVATQGVSADVAASSSLNSTVRRFAGGIGGQVTTILLASYPVVTTGQPQFAAFTLAYLIAAVLCLAGAGTVVLGRGAKAAGGPHEETAPGPPQPPSTADGHRQPSAHGERAAAAQSESMRLKPNQ